MVATSQPIGEIPGKRATSPWLVIAAGERGNISDAPISFVPVTTGVVRSRSYSVRSALARARTAVVPSGREGTHQIRFPGLPECPGNVVAVSGYLSRMLTAARGAEALEERRHVGGHGPRQDIQVGSGSSFCRAPRPYANVNGTLLSSAAERWCRTAFRLWKSDGTAAGHCVLVKDIRARREAASLQQPDRTWTESLCFQRGRMTA